jgi:hypothetical protein
MQTNEQELTKKLTDRIAELVPGVIQEAYVDCPECNGIGGHDDHHYMCDGSCSDGLCPIQVPCGYCGGAQQVEHGIPRDPTLADVMRALNIKNKTAEAGIIAYAIWDTGEIWAVLDDMSVRPCNVVIVMDIPLSGQALAFKQWLAGVLGIDLQKGGEEHEDD